MPSLIETMWRMRAVVAVAACLAGALGYLLASAQPPTWAASATLLLAAPEGEDVDASRVLQNERQRASSPAVMAAAAAQLGGQATAAGLSRRVEVTAGEDVDVLTVTATSAESPEEAAEVADAVAAAYEQVRLAERAEERDAALASLEDQRLALEARLAEASALLVADPAAAVAGQATIDVIVRQLAEMEERRATQVVAAARLGSGVESIETAQIPTEPAGLAPVTEALVWAALGVIASTVWGWWWLDRHPTVHDRLQPAELLDAPLLGQMPDGSWWPWRRRVGRHTPDRTADPAAGHHLVVEAVRAWMPADGMVIGVTGPGGDTTARAVAERMAAALAKDHQVQLSTAAPEAFGQPGERLHLVAVDTDPRTTGTRGLDRPREPDAAILAVPRGTPVEALVAMRRRLERIDLLLLGYVYVAGRQRRRLRLPRIPLFRRVRWAW
jgi:hypothetical protein